MSFTHGAALHNNKKFKIDGKINMTLVTSSLAIVASTL
jgi:hypothetical protein